MHHSGREGIFLQTSIRADLTDCIPVPLGEPDVSGQINGYSQRAAVTARQGDRLLLSGRRQPAYFVV